MGHARKAFSFRDWSDGAHLAEDTYVFVAAEYPSWPLCGNCLTSGGEIHTVTGRGASVQTASQKQVATQE
jgi:hypothetical protein